jgi:hypothetical protein
MVYLFVDTSTIKLICLKKTMLGQQETCFFEKKYETVFLDKGKVINPDLLASAVKEALSSSPDKVSDNQITLILPQEAFYFVRTQVPLDIAPSAMNSFIADKARSIFPVDLTDCLTSTFIRGTDKEKIISFFGISKDIYQDYFQALSLIDLKIQSVLPETLAYFKLFEKTLRNEKKETILYINLEKNHLSGYLFDSYGLLNDKKISADYTEETKVEEVIKNKVEELQKDSFKLNRLIISGEPSDKIRQDTFTKVVGVWTNPLKRIVPNFYEEYIKMLVVEGKKSFPLLTFDVCFGAFIFGSENKDFSFLKNGLKLSTNKSRSIKIKLPTKTILLFVCSFALSFLLFWGFSKIKLPKMPNLSMAKPTPTVAPTATPTPTPSFKKADLKIKVLNGSGIKGKATDVKDILTKKGYGEIITANADNFDYTTTEIQIKKTYSQVSSMLKTDLKDYLKTFKQTNLDSSSTADLIIIVGTDFK